MLGVVNLGLQRFEYADPTALVPEELVAQVAFVVDQLWADKRCELCRDLFEWGNYFSNELHQPCDDMHALGKKMGWIDEGQLDPRVKLILLRCFEGITQEELDYPHVLTGFPEVIQTSENLCIQWNQNRVVWNMRLSMPTALVDEWIDKLIATLWCQ